MDRLKALQVFIGVIDEGSFTKAAVSTGLARSTVSGIVRQLEERLGVQLIHRSTRRLKLTANGTLYYLISRELLNMLDAAERCLLTTADVEHGLTRALPDKALIAGKGRPPAIVRAIASALKDCTQGADVERKFNSFRI